MGLLNFEGSGGESADLPLRRPPIIPSKINSRFLGRDNVSEFSLGHKNMGKVFVDCTLRFAETEWGVLGPSPAGIIYVDIMFRQRKNHLLEWATVQISLREHKLSKREKWMGSGLSIGKYGPKTLAGKPTTRYTTDTYSLTPEVNILGATVGGVGFNRQRTTTSSSRWELHSSHIPGDDDDTQDATYRTLLWELSQNDFTNYPEHNDVFHTGLSFKHNAQPFYIQVKIKGRLRRVSDKIRGLFPPKLHPDQGKTLTLININDEYRTGKPLESSVLGLAERMCKMNLDDIPCEFPSTKPAPPQQPEPPQKPPPPYGDDTCTQIPPKLDDQVEPAADVESTRPGTRSVIEALSSAPSTYSSVEEESNYDSNTTSSSNGSGLPSESKCCDGQLAKVDTKMTEENLRILLSNPVSSMMLGFMVILLNYLAKMKMR